jgi:hypothetical protein
MSTNTTDKGRAWEWTPPPIVNRIVTLLLRLPVLHRLVSGSLLLITFTGRKSGKTYTTPAGYYRQDDDIILMTKRFRTWWRNFQEPAAETLRLRGRDVTGQAETLTEVDVIVPIITRVVEKSPREAELFHIRIDGDTVNPASVWETTPRLVIIRIRLDADVN